MTLIDTARAIVRAEAEKPQTALRRLRESVAGGEMTFPLSDRELALAAREAIRAGEPATATVALDELALRLAANAPLERAA